VTEAGDPPDDAILCDDDSPCADANSVCVPLTENFGACIQLCEADDNESSCEAQGLMEDCSGTCFSEDTCDGGCSTWLGDEFCDDGTFGVNFNCEAWNFDGGACEPADYPACADGLQCAAAGTGNGAGFCITEDSAPPADAAACDTDNPCADGYNCDTIYNVCLQWCTEDGGDGGDTGGDELTCSDTDNGAEDAYGDACEAYNNFPSWCGGYDDDDFDSVAMCCVCGGGQSG
jgi:hypothetical protein